MEDHHQVLSHVCKFCSKSFGCGRSLGGHMRSHMINDTSAQADGSKITRKKLPPLSTYLISNPNPKKKKMKRSKRRRTRYTGPENSSSISFPNNASFSASEVEQEQEEVALCLILLSRDVGRWGGSNSLASESLDEKDQGETIEIGIGEVGEVVSDDCNHLIKRKSIDSFDPELKFDTLKKFKALDGECGSVKFECTTCNKVFYSYQALGGHNKTKGCFASKINSSENSIETESSPDRTSDSNKLTNNSTTGDRVQADQMLVMDSKDRADSSNGTGQSKGLECPICLNVFPSGQALGGHKRAHLVGAPNDLHHQAKTIQAIAKQQEPTILDLNLPAPDEAESNRLVGFNPWWPGRSSYNCESLIGLIFN